MKAQRISSKCRYCGNRATLTDDQGNRWCETHCTRYEVMQWGMVHNWPEIRCTAEISTVNLAKYRYRDYAIGAGYDLWRLACSLGSDHFMGTIHATITAEEYEKSEVAI